MLLKINLGFFILVINSFCHSWAFIQGFDNKLMKRLDDVRLQNIIADNSTKQIIKAITNPISMLENGLSNVTEQCQKDILAYTSALDYQNPINIRSWALKMLDATGKLLPPSVLQGAFIDMPGNVDSCLQVDNGNYLGKYCLTYVKVPYQTPPPGPGNQKQLPNLDPNMILNILRPSLNIIVWENSLKLGLCVPNSCTEEDIHYIYQNQFENLDIQDQVVHRSDCKDKDTSPEFTTADGVALAVIIVLGCFILVGTILDLAVYHVGDFWINSKYLAIFQGFSAHHVIRKVFHVTENKDGLGCINGIRFWSMVWVIAGHTFMRFYTEETPFRSNPLPAIQDILTSSSMRLISNASPSVDSFFLIGATLLSYLTIKEVTKLKGGNFKFWALYYVHRYIRLTGALAGVIMFYTTLMKFIPYKAQNVYNSDYQGCQETWWKNIVYINNFDGEDCMGHTWYMANDMQMFIITPFIFVMMYIKPLVGNLLTGGLVIGCVSWRFYLESEHYGDADFDAFGQIYAKPWTRFAPYGIGLILGNILYHMKGKELPKGWKTTLLMTIGWLISIGSMAAIIYAFDLLKAFEHKTAYVTYQAIHRAVWGLCLAYMIFACAKGYGGPVGSFLSWNCWAPLAKLTYSCYLIHFLVLNYVSSNLAYRITISRTLVVFYTISNVIIAMGASLIPVILFESPSIHIEKLVFGMLGLAKPPQPIKYKKE